MGITIGIVCLWLGVAVLVYGYFVHRRFGIADDLRSFPAPGLVAAALLGPGPLVGAHFVLPMPPVAGIFFAVSWSLKRRAAVAAQDGQRIGRA